MKTAAIFLAPGFEECEALITVDLLRRANIQVTLVSISENLEVTGSHQIKVLADSSIQEVKNLLYDCIIMPGGMPGTTHLMESEEITDIVLKHHKENRLLAAICAAPSVYGVLSLLKDKSAVCFPGFENNLHGAHINDTKVVIYGNIITAKALGAAFEFSHAIIHSLLDCECADRILKSIYY